MEDNYISFEEKNLRKFSIEMDQPNYAVLNHPQFEVYKEINDYEEEKPQTSFITSKINTPTTTNIFYISNIKDNCPNENKSPINTQIIFDTQNKSNHQSISEEKQKISNISKDNDNSDSNANEYHSGRWTNDEHQKFIEGILKYGNEWKRVQSVIKTRSSTQARSHAQKFFLRMKKEISPKILADSDLLIQYIINSTFKNKNNITLTNDQKERLFSVIRSNLKSEETQIKSKSTSLNNNNHYNIKEKEVFSENHVNEEEYDNLGYNKINNSNIMSKKMSISDVGEKRKITFCSKKRKNSSDYILNPNDNKIFSIKKDINHKKSLDISKQENNLINKLAQKNNNLEIKRPFNELNNYNNNINNSLFISSNNAGNINNYNNSNANFIIQNNYYNIINNFNNNNNINNQAMFNNNVNNANNPINNSPNIFLNNNINNDSFNSEQNKNYNNIDIFKCKDKNKNNEISEHDKNFMNLNIKNPFENYIFFNNENFFPNSNKIKHYDNSYKNYDNADINDPFNLKFENVTLHNDNDNNNNTINNDNDNSFLNQNLEEGHDNVSEYERINFSRNNNDNERPYDD